MDCSTSLPFTVSWSLLKFISFESAILTNISSSTALFFWSFPASSGSFPVSWHFASGGQSIGCFSFSISPSNEYSRLLSFRTDWFDFAVQRTLKREISPVPQFKNITSLALSFPYGPILISIPGYWKTKILNIWTFVGKMMSLFSTLF